MAQMDEVLKSVLKEITPTEKQQREIERIKKKVISATERTTKNTELDHTLAGSYIRDTYMLDKREFDVFILFPKDTKRETLEKKGLEVGKKIVRKLKGEYKIAYAEHPYVRARVNGYDLDIVPCYQLEKATQIKSAVDRTPFHNEWLGDNLPDNLTGQVRLLKQFLKANGLYGSNTKMLGFSGYLCELLVIKYGSFQKLIKKASQWKAGRVFIDLENHYKDRKGKQKIKKKFQGEPLIVIDPVDPNRNVASVLSPANFIRFRQKCEGFTKNPSKKFFHRTRKTGLKRLRKKLKKRKTRLLSVVFPAPDVVEDVLYPQLRKTAGRLADILEENEFQVLNQGVYSDEDCFLILELEVWNLPQIRKMLGPTIFSQKHSEQFINKYKNSGRIWVEDDKYVAEIQREFTRAEEKLRDSLSTSSKKLKAKGIASHLADSISKEFHILSRKQLLKRAEKDEELADYLNRFFRKEFY